MTRHLHSLSGPDPFTPEDGYSPDQFFTPASDTKGHSERVRVNLRPDVLPALGALVASGQFEAYRSTHDVIRDAIYHRLHWLADQAGVTYRNGKLEGQLRHVVSGAAHVAEVEQAAYEQQIRVDYVAALEAHVDRCWRLRDHQALHRAVDGARARLDDGWLYEPYRSQVETIVEKATKETW